MQCLERIANSESIESKFELSKIENTLSVEKCLTHQLMVNIPKDKDTQIKAIFVLIKRFCTLINVSRNLNEDQMIQLAVDLRERFRCDSLEDVALFLKKAREGAYGDFYRLDSAVIMRWVDAYMEEKMEAFHRERINQENIKKRQENDAVSAYRRDEKTEHRLQELQDRLKKISEPQRREVRNTPLFNYQSWLEELPENAKKMSMKELETMLKNTPKTSYPDVCEIIQNEINNRI